jgi:nitrite reductase (NADH) small subunit
VCRSKITGARFAATPRVKVAGFRTTEDLFFAVEDRCPLKGGRFSQGNVHGAGVTCPLHNWVISLKTGSVGTIPLKRQRERLFAALDALANLAA